MAGIHIEDQLYPKRALYHKYVVHGIPVKEFVEKIAYSIRQRDESDPDFVIIARTDTCRALFGRQRLGAAHPQPPAPVLMSSGGQSARDQPSATNNDEEPAPPDQPG